MHHVFLGKLDGLGDVVALEKLDESSICWGSAEVGLVRVLGFGHFDSSSDS